MVRKKRDKENAGKSARSHEKHRLIRQAVQGQVFAFRASPWGEDGRILLIDGNAGDGEGVQEDQLDMLGANPSCATAELLVRIADRLYGDADVILCEKDQTKRFLLAERFPHATVIPDHAEAPSYLRPDHAYACWISDPCGPADQGIKPMAEIALSVRSDFVATLNEGFLRRVEATRSGWETSKRLYLPCRDPVWWLTMLGRRRMARTRIVKASESFHYRVLVLANYLSRPVSSPPFEVVK